MIPVHEKENNPDSQSFLDENKVHLSKQCQRVQEILNTGYKLSVMEAANKFGIMSLPRRVLDLKKGGYDITAEWVRDSTGKRRYKVYGRAWSDRGGDQHGY